ncbi:MAG: sugar ABC transporter substrate-binding protein [Firmicutes bacterium]|nr:sugar ABC transporter substrate-binding protein [Bacillota bacterium]
MFVFWRARSEVLILVLLLLLISPAAMAKTKLVHYAYTGHGEQYRQFIDHAKAIFERANANIEIEVVEGNDYTKALTMALGGVAADVLDMSTNLAFSYYVSGLLQDLTPFINADKEFRLQDFVPASLIGYQARGATFGLPSSIYQVVCFYNRDLFLQAGISEPAALGDGWTWDAALSAGKRLTRDLDGDGVPDQWGVRASNSWYRWPIWVHQAGGMLFDKLVEPTKPTFDTPAGRTGLGFLAGLHLENAAVPLTYASHELFYNGRVGFSLDDGSSWLTIIPVSSDGQFEWDVVQLPKGPVHNGTFLIMNGYQMSAATEHPEAAWEWIKHLVNRESILDFMSITGRTPSRTALLREIPKTLQVVPRNLQAVADAVLNPNSQPPYLTPIYGQLNNVTGQITRQVLLGQRSVVAALQEMEVAAAALMANLE